MPEPWVHQCDECGVTTVVSGSVPVALHASTGCRLAPRTGCVNQTYRFTLGSWSGA